MAIPQKFLDQVRATIALVGRDSDNNPAAVDVTGGGAHGYESSLGAGDEGVGSPELSRKRINNSAHIDTLLSSTSAQGIGGQVGVPVYIKGIRVHEATAGTMTIAGFSTPSSVADLANTLVLPIGTVGDVLPQGVARAFPDGCSITLSVAADGPDITVEWEAMP